MTTTRIEGADQLMANLRRINSGVKGRIGSQAIDKAGEFIQQKAHDRCAVKGETSIDGYWVSDWAESVKDPSRVGVVRRSISRVTRGLESTVGSNHMIAPKLEFGLPSNEPRPFMRPALDENADEATHVTGQELWNGIRGAANVT